MSRRSAVITLDKYFKYSFSLEAQRSGYTASLTYSPPFNGNISWWQLYVEKSWPCEDGIYEPPLLVVVSIHSRDVATSMENYIRIDYDRRHQRIFEAVRRGKNPVDLGIEADI